MNPTMDVPTRDRSLQLANRVRLTRAAHRADIRGERRIRGEARIAALLADPPEWLRAAYVRDVLTWPRGRGRAWADSVLADAGLGQSVRVGALPERGLFGILPNMVCGSAPWTPERLRAFLVFEAERLGRTPTAGEFESRLRASKHRGRRPLWADWREVCASAGLSPSEYGATSAAISTAALRDRFFASGLSPYDVAVRCGWETSRGYPDTQRVRRSLGMAPEVSRGQRRYRRRVRYDTAVALVRGMGVDPVDVGL